MPDYDAADCDRLHCDTWVNYRFDVQLRKTVMKNQDWHSTDYSNPLSTAPKDGTFVWLLIELIQDDDCSIGLLDDDTPSWTLGFNQFALSEINEWIVVGWDWCTDEFKDLRETSNSFKILGWKECNRPLHPEEIDYQAYLKEKGEDPSC